MAQETQEQQNDLLNFDWESSDTDFFGIPAVGETKPVKPEPSEEEPEKPKGKTGEEDEEDEEEDDFFDQVITPGKGKGEDPGEDPGTPKGETSVYTDLFKDLKETGLFKHVEVEGDEEIDVDRLLELQQEEYEAEVTERLKAWATKDLDDDAKAFIKFKRDGGSTEEFFKTYSKTTDLPQGSIDDENYQDSLIRYQLAQEGWDKDEIEDRIEYLTESGKKKKFAEKYDTKVKEQVNKQKEAILKQQEAAKRAAKEQENEFKETVKETLDEIDEVKGFKITDQDKTKLFNFLTKKDQKIGEDKVITGFQKKLAETFQDSERMILLAKLIESDFDFTGLEKVTKTKQTRQVKTNLEQRKNLRPSGSGSSSQGVSVADLFN